MIPKGNRYNKLVVDGTMIKLIIMDIHGGVFVLPNKYRDPIFKLRGIEILPITNGEAADYLRVKLDMPHI